jgi:hypothetical protein
MAGYHGLDFQPIHFDSITHVKLGDDEKSTKAKRKNMKNKAHIYKI